MFVIQKPIKRVIDKKDDIQKHFSLNKSEFSQCMKIITKKFTCKFYVIIVILNKIGMEIILVLVA